MKLWELPRAPREVLFHPDGSVTISGYSAADVLRLYRVLCMAGKIPPPAPPDKSMEEAER